MKRKAAPSERPSPVYERIRQILESAKANVARSVNSTQVVAYWLIGREIVEEEQKGQRRADYGERLLRDLEERLRKDFGTGYSYSNLKFIRQFYLAFPLLLNGVEIGYAVRSQFGGSRKGYALRGKTSPVLTPTLPSRTRGGHSMPIYSTILPGRQCSISSLISRKTIRAKCCAFTSARLPGSSTPRCRTTIGKTPSITK